MTATVNAIRWYQFIILTILIASVKPKCITTDYCYCKSLKTSEEIYVCKKSPSDEQDITVTVNRSMDDKDKIKINCKNEYEEADYVKWIANLSYGTTRETHLEIAQCPVPNVPFANIVGVFNTTLINELTFTQATFPDSAGLSLEPYHFANLSSIKIISLSNNPIVQLPEKLFATRPDLEKLWLMQNNLQNLPEKIFEPLKKLKDLSLFDNGLSSLDSEIFKSLIALTDLSLSENKLDNLPKSIFNSLTKLKKLDLSNNNMKILNDGIFDNLKNLETLILSGNKLIWVPQTPFVNNLNLKEIISYNTFDKLNFTLPSGFFANLRSLKKVDLAWNNLTSLPKEIFKGSVNLETLRLGENRLSKLDDDLFFDLKNLKTLKINKNQLTNVTIELFRGLEKLAYLDLSHNQLSMNRTHEVSPLHKCTTLIELELNNNFLSKVYKDWRQSFNTLTKLDLSHNKIENLTVDDFCFPISTSPIVNYRNNIINRIDLTNGTHRLKNYSTTFNIEGNPIKCDCNALTLIEYLQSKPSETRAHITTENMNCSAPQSLRQTSLKNVDVKDLKCSIDQIDTTPSYSCPKNCSYKYRSKDNVLEVECACTGTIELPRKIPNANYSVELSFDGNNLTSIDGLNMTEKDRSRVVVLSLSHNKLNKIDGIEQFTRLKALKLNNNLLTNLDHKTIKRINSLKNLTNITLHDNVWKCDCDMIDFLHFVKHSDKIQNKEEIKCKDDNSVINNLRESQLCSILFIYILIIATVGIALMGTSGLAVYLIYRREIRVWMFAHKFCLWLVAEKELDKDKIYDAFVSFSHKDQEFVDKHLIPHLEKNNDHNYKLCIHYRDFVVGEFIPSQIVYSVENSKRTIIVLTPNFLESIWARMEFRTAHLKAIKEGCTRVIIVILEDVNKENLDPELNAYITMNTYVKWGDPLFWEKLKYALPHPQAYTKRRTSNIALLNVDKQSSRKL